MNFLLKQTKSLLIFPKYQFKNYYRFCAIQQNTEILEEVKAKIFQVLRSAAKCKQDKLSDTATFEELGFDSLDGVEMVVALEENFGFDVSNEEAEKITGVSDAVTIFYKYAMEKINKEALVQQEKK